MDVVEKYRQRRDARIKKRLDDDWITVKGTHVMIDDEGKVTKGPESLKKGKAYKTKGLGLGSPEDSNAKRRMAEENVKMRDRVTTSEEDFEKEGYKKNEEGVWEKKRPRTKLEVMKENQDRYQKVQKEISGMKSGIERDVKEKLILPWIKGEKWMGGISDRKFSDISKKMPYSFDDIYDEFQKQMMKY